MRFFDDRISLSFVRCDVLADRGGAAAMALGKTVAFLLYAPLVAFLMLIPAFLDDFQKLSTTTQNVIAFSSLGAGEASLLLLIIRGWLPGTRRGFVQPFNEKQIGIGATVLSILAWVIVGHTFVGGLFRVIVSSAVIISGVVYCVTKSVVTRRLRYSVLAVVILPCIEIAYEMKTLPPPVLRTCRAVLGP